MGRKTETNTEKVIMIKGVIKRNVSPRRVRELEALGFVKEEPVMVSSLSKQTKATVASTDNVPKSEPKVETKPKTKTKTKPKRQTKSKAKTPNKAVSK